MNKIILIIILFLASCLKTEQKKDPLNSLQSFLSPTVKIDYEIAPKQFETELKLIKNVKVSLLKFYLADKNKSMRLCLWGIEKEKMIEFGLVPIGKSQSCREAIAHNSIWNFEVGKPVKLEIIYEKMKSLKFTGSDNQKMQIDLPGLATMNSKSFDRYSNAIKWRGIPSLIILNNEVESDESPVLKIPNGKYSDQRLTVCHKMNDLCEEEITFSCDQCPGAWIETFDRDCPLGGTKFCASEKCGEKGEPSCLLGKDWLSPDIDPICTKEDQRVFCRPNQTQFCDTDGISICL